MLVQCDKCHSRFEISDNLIGQDGRKLRCSFCQGVFWVMPQAKAAQGETLLDHEEELDQELDGTMVLSLFHRPKLPAAPAPAVRRGGNLAPAGSPETPQPNASGEERAEAGLRRVNMPPARKAEILQKTGWFHQLSWEEVKQMAPYWEMFLVPEGTILFQPGDRNANLGLVVKGAVTISDPSRSDGDDDVLAVLGPGQSLGELSFLDGQPRGGRAFTRVETYLFILSKKRAERLADDLPKIWRRIMEKLISYLCRRVRVTHGNRTDFLVASSAESGRLMT